MDYKRNEIIETIVKMVSVIKQDSKQDMVGVATLPMNASKPFLYGVGDTLYCVDEENAYGWEDKKFPLNSLNDSDLATVLEGLTYTWLSLVRASKKKQK